MKKATPLSRVIDIFSTAPIEQCEDLLDAAKQIVRNRRERQTPTRRRKSTTTADDEGAAS